jgi:glycosyltransferase involved in cell wall biosynthesis
MGYNNTIIQGRDIVVVGQQPWDIEIGSNCKNIAVEFSKLNRVLYVNSPLDRITLYKHRKELKILKRLNVIQGKENGIVQIQENLWNLFPDKMIESINWIKSQTIFEFLNKINNKRFASSIKKAIKLLGFKDVILFNDNDMFRCFYLKELLKPRISIYYSRDYMLAVDYWKLHGEKLEPELITNSDLCVANSSYLANYCKRFNHYSYYVGQGCELDIFMHIKDTKKPGDILAIPNPIIGYVGALQSLRLDLKVIAHIAESNPEWSIILVGPEDSQFKKSALHKIKNVYFIGSKDPEQLPSYINAFDVCINPQIVSQVTIGNYPRKIDEYLAVGKPVVATKTEAMSIFSDHTYLSETKEEYIEMIEKALKEDSEELKQERKVFASSHTWANSVEEIYKAINERNSFIK